MNRHIILGMDDRTAEEDVAAAADVAVVRASAAIKAADYLLVASGAGLSADSGLPVYVDAALVSAWQRQGLSYQELCDTLLLIKDPACAFGFWTQCLRSYRHAVPHAGYAILERWLESREPERTACYTSNVDGYLRRFAALSRRLCEIHGCLEEWMCGSSMGFTDTKCATPELNQPNPLLPCLPALRNITLFSATAQRHPVFGSAGGCVPRRGHLWAAHHETMLARRALSAESAAEPTLEKSVCLPGSTSCATLRVTPPPTWPPASDAELRVALRPPCTVSGRTPAEGGCDDASCSADSEGGADWGAMPPVCRACGTLLRPAVLMFGDTDPVLLARLRTAADAYQRWEDEMETAVAADRSLSLVVLEVGCGTRVPSVRVECEQVVADVCARGGRATLVRINPEPEPSPEPSAGGGGVGQGREGDASVLPSDAFVYVRGTALEALTKIDALISCGTADDPLPGPYSMN